VGFGCIIATIADFSGAIVEDTSLHSSVFSGQGWQSAIQQAVSLWSDLLFLKEVVPGVTTGQESGYFHSPTGEGWS